MAQVSVTERTRLHARRLEGLRTRLGITKGHLMDALGFKSTQTYDLYERGKSVIRLDRVDDWAAAFGLPVMDFAAELLIGDEISALADGDEALERDVRRDLARHGPETQREILDRAQEMKRIRQ